MSGLIYENAIIVAFGVQIRDFTGAQELVDYLNANADAKGNSTWIYPKGARAKAKFKVELVYTMAEFVRALDTADAYVVYEGHSRFGQGPAFGPAKTPELPDATAFPVNPWGVHYRMGYDATETDAVGDLLEHSVSPSEYDLTATPATPFLHPALVKTAKGAAQAERERKATNPKPKTWCSRAEAWRAFDLCVPTLAATATARADQPLKNRHFYAKVRELKGKTWEDEFKVAVEVGSADLDKSSLKCAVLFMASCSSYQHFFKPLDRRRRAVKSQCKFYMTNNLCSAAHSVAFVEQVFNGNDPTIVRGSKKTLGVLNGLKRSGLVGIY